MSSIFHIPTNLIRPLIIKIHIVILLVFIFLGLITSVIVKHGDYRENNLDQLIDINNEGKTSLRINKKQIVYHSYKKVGNVSHTVACWIMNNMEGKCYYIRQLDFHILQKHVIIKAEFVGNNLYAREVNRR